MPIVKLKSALVALAILCTTMLLVAGCQKNRNRVEGISVVASTTIVGDVVKNVAGDALKVETLLPYGASPHDYNPTPKDVNKISVAEKVFINGLGLESQMMSLFSNTKEGTEIVTLSEYIKTRELKEEHHHDGQHDDHHHHGIYDPHVWTDPENIIEWVKRIETHLTQLLPDSADYFADNAKAYLDSLQILDEWIQEQVVSLPAVKRKLVTDHKVFGYFADKYGFEQVGAVIPSFSSLSQPSARDIAQLEEIIVEKGVNVIFVGKSANHTIPERISSDLKIRMVVLLTGSLDQNGPGSTYVGYMKYNVKNIVEALGS